MTLAKVRWLHMDSCSANGAQLFVIGLIDNNILCVLQESSSQWGGERRRLSSTAQRGNRPRRGRSRSVFSNRNNTASRQNLKIFRAIFKHASTGGAAGRTLGRPQAAGDLAR